MDMVKKTGAGKYSALCPCHAEKTPSLVIKEDDGNVICHCFGCGANGVDVVNALGLDISELFKEKNAMTKSSAPYNRPTQQEQERALNAKFLSEVSATTRKITDGDPVTKYLNNRGIKIIPPTIRFLPEYKQDGVYHPCLIARLDDKDGNRVSYKVIHLTNEGQKANVPIVKKTLPCERDMRGSAVKLFAHNGTLAVCEGIETAIAYYQDTKIAAWGLDNADNLSKFDCPADVKHLVILADMDSSFVGQSAAYALAKKSHALIGKQGYQLETVAVKLLLRFQHDFEVMIDHGIKCDYLDYLTERNA